jgi:branched-chain amino acid transport system permease protein
VTSTKTGPLNARMVLPLAAAVAGCVAPFVMGDLTFLMHMVLAAIVVTGLSLLMGYAGQASLGQGAFVAAGALTVALGTTRWGLPPLLTLVAAPFVAGAFATVVGVPLLRLKGHYLAFGTLALLLMVQTAMSTFDFLGGAFGISGIPPFGARGLVFADQRPYVLLALGLLALVLFVNHRVVNSRFGRGVRALAGSETAAESAGVPVMRSKLTIFALSAMYAGLAGGLSAFFTPYVSPDSFPALESFTYVIMAVVGGLGTLWGGVVGAVLVSTLLQVLNNVSSNPDLPPTLGPILQYATYGGLLVLALLFMPRGIVPAVETGVGRVGRLVRRPPAVARP